MVAAARRALVTGCAGFIGSHLTESLLADGIDVVGVDCFNENYGRREKLHNLVVSQEWDGFDFVPIDLSRGDLRDLVADTDVVFHLAAEPGVRASWGPHFGRYVRNNVMATQQLLDAASEWPEKRLVFASSSSVYGQAESFPTPETATPRPLSPYGMTKLAAEHLCMLYHANHGVDVTSLRFFTVYGPRQRPDMAFDIFCRAALREEPITVYGDGLQTRDFTYVGDVVRALRLAAGNASAGGGIYNIGGGSQVGLRSIIDLLRELVATEVEVIYGQRQLGDVRDTGADTTRARDELGFVPQMTLREGLERQFESVRRTAGTASTASATRVSSRDASI